MSGSKPEEVKRLALINANGQVENIIIAEAGYRHSALECVPLADNQYCEIGCEYDRQAQTFRLQNTESVRSLEQAKQAKIAQLEVQVNQAITGGFTSSALGTPHYYDSQLHDQVNLSLSMELLRNAPLQTINFACVSAATKIKEMRPHTFIQFQVVLKDGAAANLKAREQYRSLVNQVNAAKSIEQIEAIQWV